jgi:hypothetical protein
VENWMPLFTDKGVLFSPVLMAELDAIKKTPIASLMLGRDWGKRDPWLTYPKEGEVDLTDMSRKEVIRAAGLRDELSFASFRHGGLTEAGDAEVTNQELMAQGRHKSRKVLGKTRPLLLHKPRSRLSSGTSHEQAVSRSISFQLATASITSPRGKEWQRLGRSGPCRNTNRRERDLRLKYSARQP